MKWIAIGAHLLRDDVEPVAEAVPVGDLFLSAVQIADDQPLGERELLVRVAGVRAQLLETATFIALRYGFTFWSADHAQSKTLQHLPAWKHVLTEHRSQVEMTLKIAAESSHPRPDRKEFTSGAEYLRALQAATQGASVDPRFRTEAERLVLPLAARHQWVHRDEKSMELALLVERESVQNVIGAGEELRATGVPFLLSGPWPLEVFADDDRE